MNTRCPVQEELHAHADPRDESLSDGRRAELDAHVAECASCDAALQEARRFRTLLLKTRVPSMAEEQWELLHERVALMSTEPPPRQASWAAKAYWGFAIAASVALCGVGLSQWLQARGKTTQAVASVASTEGVASNEALVVSAAEGLAQLSTEDGHFQNLSAGASVRGGTQVRSASQTVRLVVGGNFELTLEPHTLVSFERGDARHVFIRLRRGEVTCQVAKRRRGQRFGVLAGAYRAEVVGTEFTVSYPSWGEVGVTVHEGTVRVDEATLPTQRRSDTTMMVRAGHQWRVRGGRIELGPLPPEPSHTEQEEPKQAHAPKLSKPEESDVDAPQPKRRRPERSASTSATHRQTEVNKSEGPRVGAHPRAKRQRRRRVIINLPPQRMTDDEIRRAKELERDQNRAGPLAPKSAPTQHSTPQ